MKKIYLMFIFVVTCSIFFVGNSYSQQKIAYIDKENVLKQMPEYKKVEEEFNAITKAYVDTLKAIENVILQKADSLKTETARITEKYQKGEIKSEAELNEYQSNLDSLKSNIYNLQGYYDEYKKQVNTELQEKQEVLLKPLKERMYKALDDVAKELKLSFIFDKSSDLLGGPMLFGEKDADITFKVLDKLK